MEERGEGCHRGGNVRGMGHEYNIQECTQTRMKETCWFGAKWQVGPLSQGHGESSWRLSDPLTMAAPTPRRGGIV